MVPLILLPKLPTKASSAEQAYWILQDKQTCYIGSISQGNQTAENEFYYKQLPERHSAPNDLRNSTENLTQPDTNGLSVILSIG